MGPAWTGGQGGVPGALEGILHPGLPTVQWGLTLGIESQHINGHADGQDSLFSLAKGPVNFSIKFACNRLEMV